MMVGVADEHQVDTVGRQAGATLIVDHAAYVVKPDVPRPLNAGIDEVRRDIDRIDQAARADLARHHHAEKAAAGTDVRHPLTWLQPELTDDIVAPVPDLPAIALEYTAPLSDTGVLVLAIDPWTDVLLGVHGHGEDGQHQQPDHRVRHVTCSANSIPVMVVHASGPCTPVVVPVSW